ncbi:MAG TPA: hypothetical protein VIJ25_08495, partial [Methylococcales bacterium]
METVITPSPLKWKANWPQTRQRFVNWWNRRGCMVGGWCVEPKNDACHAVVEPVACPSHEARYTDPVLRARLNHADLSCRHFWGDLIPV